MRKKGQLAIFLVFVVLSVIIIFISAVAAPFLSQFSAEAYRAGEKIWSSTNGTIDEIQSAEAREALQGSVNNALDSVDTNINIQSNLFKYGWVFLVVLVAITLVLITRQLVEFRGGSGGLV